VALGSHAEGRPEDAAMQQSESSDIWIDPRWKTTSRASGAKSLFGLDTVVEIKQIITIEWVGKERFLDPNKIVKKNLGPRV
jgi:hypothetical protein